MAKQKIGKLNPFYGKHHTEESKKKISVANKAKPAWNKGLKQETDERVAKYTEKLIGRKGSFKGKVHSDETKEKMSKSQSGRKHSEETKEKMKKAWETRSPITEKTRAKLREAAKYKPVQTEETKKKRSDTLMNHQVSMMTRSKMSKNRKGKCCGEQNPMNNPETVEKCRIAGKRKWQNPEYVKKIQDALQLRPNKPESIILTLLNDLYPNEWKYTGDFSFMINGKNPDFVNCNGQKQCIELFGDYWHKGENPQDRKAIFREFGYETLVIWEHELRDMNIVKNKIYAFCGSYEEMMVKNNEA